MAFLNRIFRGISILSYTYGSEMSQVFIVSRKNRDEINKDINESVSKYSYIAHIKNSLSS